MLHDDDSHNLLAIDIRVNDVGIVSYLYIYIFFHLYLIPYRVYITCVH